MTTKENLQQLKVIVQEILKTDEQSRNSDSLLYLRVLERVSKDAEGNDMPLSMTVAYFLAHMKEHGFPPFESVRRTRQKLQAKCPELKACEKVQAMRQENEKEYKDFALQPEKVQEKVTGRPSRKVKHLETGKIYPNTKAAAMAIGGTYGGLNKHLVGKAASYKGQHFAYTNKHNFTRSDTLCWQCAKAFGGCSWTGRDEHGVVKFQPVPGWTAEQTMVTMPGGKTVSYCVFQCPEFVPDRQNGEGCESHG